MFDLLKNVGLPELLVIAIILIAVFGGQKIKELAGSLGESAREIKKVKNDLDGVKAEVADIVGGGK